MPARNPDTVNILGIEIDRITQGEVLQKISAWAKSDRLHMIATCNPEFIMLAQKNPKFRQLISQADLRIPDGIGLVYAAKYLSRPIKERVSGADLVESIAARAAAAKWKLFLLGGRHGAAARAADLLQKRYPGLTIAGSLEGSPDSAYDSEARQIINDSGADILFVGYGAPKQELWIGRNGRYLPKVRVAIGVGGTFDYHTLGGHLRRAPKLIRQAGLEWLWRLMREPRRIRRQLAIPKFMWKVFKTKVKS